MREEQRSLECVDLDVDDDGFLRRWESRRSAAGGGYLAIFAYMWHSKFIAKKISIERIFAPLRLRPCTLPSSSSSLVASTCRELAGVSFCRYPIMLKSLALLSLCASSALGFVASGAERTARQSTSAGFVSLSGVSRSTSQLEAHKLVLIRHGESEWNDLNIFTGWADAALNEKGLREAAQGGQLLKDAGRRG